MYIVEYLLQLQNTVVLFGENSERQHFQLLLPRHWHHNLFFFDFSCLSLLVEGPKDTRHLILHCEPGLFFMPL